MLVFFVFIEVYTKRVHLFELWFSIQTTAMVMSGVYLHFMGLSTQNKDVMTSKKCFKCNHPTMPIRLTMYGRFDLTTFLGQLGSDL